MALVNIGSKTKRIVRRSWLEARSITTVYSAVELDLTEAPLEPGDHELRIVNICGSVTLRVPEHIGIQLDATAVWSELKTAATAGSRQARLEHDWLSENIEHADVRVVLTFHGVLAELTVVRVPVSDVSADSLLPDDATAAGDRLLPYQGVTKKLGRVD